MADNVLIRLLTSPVPPLPRRQVWFAGDDRARGFLRGPLGIELRDLTEAGDHAWGAADLLVWMPGEEALGVASADAARAALAGGAALLAFCERSELLPPIEEPPVYARATQYRGRFYVFQEAPHWTARDLGAEYVKMAVVDRINALTNGLSNAELFRPSHHRGTARLANYELRGGRDWESLCRPGVIAYRRRGPGEQAVVALAREPDGTLSEGYQRAAHVLLVNMGAVSRDPRADVLHRNAVPVDLRPHCTMGFADEKAGDGKGGWSDQGPTNDLSGLPLGRQTFAGIPFDLIDPATNGGLSCVVLGSSQRLREKPREVTNIELGGEKLEALCFLHTTAWARSGQIGEYRVHYAKATELVETVPIVGGRNIGDWWNAADTAEAVVAWSGHNRATRVGAYLFIWKNPRPDIPVEAVDVISHGDGPVLGLLALTALR